MPAKKKSKTILPVDRVSHRIYFIRGQRVILSADLAILYGVQAKVLNQAVSRNNERFPEDFMFQLDADEFDRLKAGEANSPASLRSQSVTLKNSARGKHAKYLPYAFTEQGVAMLSAVLRSPTAIRVSIEIVRAFVHLRQLLATHEELRHHLEALERKLDTHDHQILSIIDAIQQLMDPPDDENAKPPIGFNTELAPSQKQSRYRFAR